MYIVQKTQNIQERKDTLLKDINDKIDRYTESQNHKKNILLYICGFALLLIIPLSLSILKENSHSKNFVFHVPKGSVSNISLLDGTKVYLNGGSSLILSADFSKNNRKIHFDGEGFFEVKKDSKHPFTINTPQFKVEVIGTQFNLNSGNLGSTFNLTMKEGTVKLIANQDDFSTRLTKNQQFIYNATAKEYTINSIDSNDLSSWHTGKLVFRNSTLYEISKQLERQFNVVIHIEDVTLQKYTYFAEFKNNETLTQILDLLSYKDDWRFVMDTNAVSIIKNN